MGHANSIAAKPQSKPETPRQREHVLIVAHGDGWVEVFAEKHIDAHIVMMPYVDSSAECERLCEEFFEGTLPIPYRQIYWPGNRRAATTHRIVKPSDIARRTHAVALSQAIGRAAELLRTAPEVRSKRA